MRQHRFMILVVLLLGGGVIMLSSSLLAAKADLSLSQSELIRERARGIQEVSRLATENSLLQGKLESLEKVERELKRELAESEAQGEMKAKLIEEAARGLAEAREVGQTLKADLAATKALLGACEEAQDQEANEEEKEDDGEGGHVEGLNKWIAELEFQNKRLVEINNGLQEKLKQQQVEGEQRHWKSEAARAQTQSDGSLAVIAYVVRRNQLEEFWLSLELLEANFLYCHPYPVVVFAGDDFTDTEVLSIREKLPTAISVTFELICLDTCVYGGLSSVEEIEGLMAANNVKMELGELNKERFLAGEIFRHPALADYDYLWYMEPTTFLLDEVTEDPFTHLEVSKCQHAISEELASDQTKSDAQGSLAIYDAFTKIMKESTEWIFQEEVDRVRGAVSDSEGQYSHPAFATGLEITNLRMWRGSKWLTIFDFLDQSKIFYQYDWRADYVRAMSIPLLTDPSSICRTSSVSITFSFVEYPPENVIDEAMARNLDRCSRFFNHNEETFHQTEAEAPGNPVEGENRPVEQTGATDATDAADAADTADTADATDAAGESERVAEGAAEEQGVLREPANHGEV